MKKRITVCAVLFAFAVLSATAQQYYPGLGTAYALYKGTTRDTTIVEVYNNTMRSFTNDSRFSTPVPFNGKLSKRQSDLLWKALGQYDYATGEIYFVAFAEGSAPLHFFSFAVQINVDRSCTWMGFTYNFLAPY